jgi:ATP-dependent DNA helicase RecG
MADKPGAEASEKLSVLEKTSDGFEIAEADLKLRGPGELLGTAQSGISGLKLGDLVAEFDLVQQARDLAHCLIREDPELKAPEHLHLRALSSDDRDAEGVVA